VPENASQEQIKAAYKAKAFTNHPDRGGNEDDFKAISEAFSVLSGKAQSQQGNPFDFDGFNMDFSSFFGAPPRKKQRPPGDYKDIGLEVTTNIQEIVDGKEFNLEFTKSIDCQSCAGIGGTNPEVCKRCNGVGAYGVVRNMGMFSVNVPVPCNSCNTQGKTFQEPCKTCHGAGYEVIKEKMKFKMQKI
jgi:molecular chaperone DnaJ